MRDRIGSTIKFEPLQHRLNECGLFQWKRLVLRSVYAILSITITQGIESHMAKRATTLQPIERSGPGEMRLGCEMSPFFEAYNRRMTLYPIERVPRLERRKCCTLAAHVKSALLEASQLVFIFKCLSHPAEALVGG
jgi:hypothetical protein